MKSGNSVVKRATYQSAGYDIPVPADIELTPKKWTTIDTGISFDGSEVVLGSKLTDIYEHWVMLIVPRSSMGREYGLRCKNTVGVIDADFRGNIQLCVTVDKPLSLRAGERIAQGILLPFGIFENEATPSASRKGGIGSTGR